MLQWLQCNRPTTFPRHGVPKCCTVDESGEPQDALQSYRLLSAYKTFTINNTFDEEPHYCRGQEAQRRFGSDRRRTQEEEEAKIKLTFPCVLISIRQAESKGIQFQKAHRYLRPCYHM